MINTNKQQQLQQHPLVNLPHLLLNKIISNLDNNLDRICFSLVCKRWYLDRSKYLLFNKDYSLLQTESFNDFKHFYLKSYRSQLEHCREIKNNCILFIGSINQVILNLYYDYIISYDEIIEPNYIIPKSVVKIVFSEDFNSNLEPLRCKIEESNVTSLKFGGSFNQPFKPNLLSLNIKEIILYSEFSDVWNHPLDIGYLPESLERLTLSDAFDQPLHPHVLPNSIKYLKFGRYFEQELQVGSIPSTLEELEFHRYSYHHKICDEVLPPTLHTIINMSSNWLVNMKALPNITKLSISWSKYKIGQPKSLPNANTLPNTIIDLDFGYKVYILRSGMIPESVRILNIGNGTYKENLSEIFPVCANYDVLKLGLKNYEMKPNTFFPKMKKLVFPEYYNDALTPGSIPYGVESVNLGSLFNHNIEPGVIPNSTKELILSYKFSTPFIPNALPNSLEHIRFQCYTEQLPPNAIPPSVTRLTVAGGFFRKNHLESLSTNIISIDIIDIEEEITFRLRRLDNSHFIIISSQKKKLVGGFIPIPYYKKINQLFEE